ncbi:MAG TPA: hypothetical protein VGU22_09100 [Methylomirabilota bacterium]|jgi:predicted RNase H-like HicB family nuclease|nr:hypothetical protein [Methylomirabilota bacterium]
MAMRRYTAILEKDGDQGTTVETATANLKEAVESGFVATFVTSFEAAHG